MIYLGFINLIAFLLMGIDKFYAIHNHYRISELFLILIAISGGTFGELLGMYYFHHKTLKSKFNIGLPILSLVYFCILLKIIF